MRTKIDILILSKCSVPRSSSKSSLNTACSIQNSLLTALTPLAVIAVIFFVVYPVLVTLLQWQTSLKIKSLLPSTTTMSTRVVSWRNRNSKNSGLVSAHTFPLFIFKNMQAASGNHVTDAAVEAAFVHWDTVPFFAAPNSFRTT